MGQVRKIQNIILLAKKVYPVTNFPVSIVEHEEGELKFMWMYFNSHTLYLNHSLFENGQLSFHSYKD